MAFRLANVNGRAALTDGVFYVDVATTTADDAPADLMEAIGRPELLHELMARFADFVPTGRLAEVELGPPVTRPRNVFALGLNYLDHAAEGSVDPPKRPLVFTKFPSCLCGPTADIEMRSDHVDYEGELVVVIGRAGKDIERDNAWAHVAGLTVGQDVSDRRMQFAAQPPHFDLGKSFDTFGPIGPVLVSPDCFDDPTDLVLRTQVNGELRQESSTSAMLFDIPTIIAYLSRVTALSSGDLIFTGTPAGVGGATGRFLRDGDLVTTSIEGIGTLRNQCRRVSDY